MDNYSGVGSMTDQEQINTLKDENLCLKDENSILEFQLKNRLDENVSLVEQIDALKAQVNRLRIQVTNSMNVIANEYPEDQWNYYGYSDMYKALEITPEQCLAEVKAKAIEEALLNTEAIGSNGHDYDYDGAELQKYADMLRGQVTVSDQLD